MQTFLPYEDFVKSASVLDMRRLGKQRVEAWQIYLALTQNSGWKHHPAVKMWRGCEAALCKYGIAICDEWVGRGYKDTMLTRFKDQVLSHPFVLPKWLGSEQFHQSHQSNLLRKFHEHYSKFWPNIPNNLEYCWPVS